MNCLPARTLRRKVWETNKIAYQHDELVRSNARYKVLAVLHSTEQRLILSSAACGAT
jgi:hypothetical protein